MGCPICSKLNVPRPGVVAWIVHSSVDEATRFKIPTATRAHCETALKHMDLVSDKRVSLRRRLESRLREIERKERRSGNG
jgi:hypothetical protein